VHRSARGVVVEFAELSDPGRDPTKQINEDSSGYLETAHGHLAVVCDGMGGHAAGRAASQTALSTMLEHVQSAGSAPDAAYRERTPAEVLKRAMEAAGRAVYAIGGDAPANLRPGSTSVAVLVHEGGAEVAHVGDSRAYLLRSSSVQRLTRDHSMVQQMVIAGMLDAQQAAAHPDANKLTRALGMTPDVEVELAPHPIELRAGDVILLASDGLCDLVTDDEILNLVGKGGTRGPAATCQELVAVANARGGYDNITVQLLSIVEMPAQRGFPSTLVDTRQGTTKPGETLVDAAVPARKGPQATLPDDTARPAPTLFDEGPYPQRTTAPDLGPVSAASVRSVHVPVYRPSGSEGLRALERARRGRVLFWIAVLVVFAIVVGVALWWAALGVDTGR
jgi:PPM family protein phosphatase